MVRRLIIMNCALALILTACISGNTSQDLTETAASGNRQTKISPAQQTLDAIPTNTPTPSNTPTPTPLPVVVNDWGNYNIQTLCLDVVLTYPQFDQDMEVPVEEVTNGILTRMGLIVVPAGSDCDASLTIDLEINAKSDRYQDGDEIKICYSGSSAYGTMTLEALGREPLQYGVRGDYAPPLISGCRKEPNLSTNAKHSYLPGLVTGLTDFWGISVAAAVLERNDKIARLAVLQNYKIINRDDLIFLLPHLIRIIDDGDYTPGHESYFALQILSQIGSEALPAVPDLIRGLERQMTEENPWGSGEWPYANALADITGQLSWLDPEFWWDWWDANKPEEY